MLKTKMVTPIVLGGAQQDCKRREHSLSLSELWKETEQACEWLDLTAAVDVGSIPTASTI